MSWTIDNSGWWPVLVAPDGSRLTIEETRDLLDGYDIVVARLKDALRLSEQHCDTLRDQLDDYRLAKIDIAL